MKTKILLALLGVSLLLSPLTYAQTDSLKIYTIKSSMVEIGKYYEVSFPEIPSVKGKLLAVNKSTILVLTDNRIDEIEIGDIIGIRNIQADNIVFSTTNHVKFKHVNSISGGYNQRSSDNY